MSSELNWNPESDDPAFEAGYQFVERNKATADDYHRISPLWHGWMVRQAFWCGVKWQRELGICSHVPEEILPAGRSGRRCGVSDYTGNEITYLRNTIAKLEQQLAEARARITTLEGHLQWVGWSSEGVEQARQELAAARAEIQRATAHWESLNWLSNPQEKPASGVPIDKAMAAAVNTIIRLRESAEKAGGAE